MTDAIERAILNIRKQCRLYDGIVGKIIGVSCSDTHFLYECAWFANGDYKVGRFEEYEVEVIDE